MYKNYLLNEKNMTDINLNCDGYNKLLITVVNKNLNL